MATLQLHGCALEPLGDYLKALGVFRLVSEQISADVRCWWKHGVFHLWIPEYASYRAAGEENKGSFSLPHDEAGRRAWVEHFLLEACEFSPFLAPWQKNTGWHPQDTGAESEKGSTALLTSLQSHQRGFGAYMRAVDQLLEAEVGYQAGERDADWKLKQLRGWLKRSAFDDPQKRRALFESLRNSVTDSAFTAWMDTIAHSHRGRRETLTWFRLLGKTGAGEGRGAYVATLNAAYAYAFSSRDSSALRHSLWGEYVTGGKPLGKEFSIGLFYPGRKGDPNMGQAFEREEIGNAWDVILLFEGLLLFAGSMAKRMSARWAAPAFPFYCASSLGGNAAAGPSEIDGSQKGISSGEVWCPVWSQPATLRDLTGLFSEGRMQVSGRDARLATQFVRALSRHGCDRGVAAFQRYGLLRRSGSFGKKDQTSTLAVPLGLYSVTPNSNLELLDEVFDYEDDVLDASGRRAVVTSDSQPRRIIWARRRLEEAIFEAARTGLELHKAENTEQTINLRLKLMNVAVAAAALERECAITDGRIHDREGKMPDRKGDPNVPCAPSLSYDWLRFKHVAPSEPPKLADLWDDGTAEWRLARAVGTICPWGKKSERSGLTEPSAAGPIRENLVRAVRSERRAFWKWEPKSRRAVWLWGRDALTNCASVLQRRLIDAQAGSGDGLPLFSPYGAGANELLALWQGQVDDGRLGELLHAFALIRPWRPIRVTTPEVVGDDVLLEDGNSNSDDVVFHVESDDRADTTSAWFARLEAAAQLPRAYALLKLCFLGGQLPPRPGQARSGHEPHAPGNLHILNLLMAGRGEEACTAAARRLQAVGYPPLFATSRSFSAGFVLSTADCRRLAGLLLVPITFAADLARLIIKPIREDHDD